MNIKINVIQILINTVIVRNNTGCDAQTHL